MTVDVVRGREVQSYEKPSFAMRDYIEGNRWITQEIMDREVSFESRLGKIHECGTAACAMGWSHLVVANKLPMEPFFGYIRRVFLNEESKDRFHLGHLNTLSSWLFSADWAYTAPEPKDVLTRLAYFEADPDRFFAQAQELRSSGDWMVTLWKEACGVQG